MEQATLTGLERIEGAFAAARDEDRAALMPYLMGGFPDLDGSRRIGIAYAQAGADIVELGIPYSDASEVDRGAQRVVHRHHARP